MKKSEINTNRFESVTRNGEKKKSRKHCWQKAAAAVLTLGLLTGLTACGSTQTEVPELLEPVQVKMDLAEVTRGDVGVYTSYKAQLVPFVEELSFTMEGRVKDIFVTYGDEVRKGDVLATLDKEDVHEQVERLEQEIAHIVTTGEFADEKAALNISIARQELAYLIRLGAYEQRIEIKRADIREMEDALLQDQELRQLELEEKERVLSELKEEVGNNQIISPVNGKVVYLTGIKVGMNVQSYEPVLLVSDDESMYLSSEYISEGVLKMSDIVYAQIGGKQYEITYLPYSLEEQMEMMLEGAEINSRFTVEAPEGELENGQYASIVTVRSYRENVLTVPINALYRDASGRYVYKMEDGERIRCEVEVGIESETKAELKSGVQEGDMVYVKN